MQLHKVIGLCYLGGFRGLLHFSGAPPSPTKNDSGFVIAKFAYLHKNYSENLEIRVAEASTVVSCSTCLDRLLPGF